MSDEFTQADPVGPLSPADADALDALAEAGFDLDQVPPAMAARARRLAVLLGLLEPSDPPASHAARSTLIDATLVRAARESRVPEPTLAPADAAAFEALVEADWQVDRVPPRQAERAARAVALLSTLETADDPALFSDDARRDRIDRVMARVEGRARRRMAPAREPFAGRSRFQLRDVISAAAMILIAFGVLWPTITAGRESARRAVCEVGMQNAGLGFSLYASDNRGELPRVEDHARQGRKWWYVGDAKQSHSANLFLLVSMGYTPLSDLSCPGNAQAPINLNTNGMSDWRTAEEVSYSYQLFPADSQSPKWGGPVRIVVLTDKSPVVDRARRGERFDPEARSHNHRGHGQNVLFNDGSVEWLTRPVLRNGDNVWLPRSIQEQGLRLLEGNERPASRDDAFVGP
ncbi:MAG: hypothetical protein VYC34_06475 [Planctomycetota bacterium]|nr:hypothetical protein [Planctomycetota bacterium]